MESQTLVHNRAPAAGARLGEAPRAGVRVLGRYLLQERLGAGGFGVVWRAHDELLARAVAVKRIALAPEEDGERASREALASARLAHPAIVAMYEACAEGEAFYLISELVDGETLARLTAERALDDRQVLEIGVALCGALAHAHSRGVIHRDVKPQNVLVPRSSYDPSLERGEDGAVAKLTDFGGARLSEAEVLTRTGDVLGTLAYMSPEQSEGHAAAEPADLYSLALVLYEALTGINPVRGSTPADTVRRIGRPVVALGRARGDLPRGLTNAIDRALQPRASSRGSLHELSLALHGALQDGSLGDRELDLARQGPELLVRERRRRPRPRVAPATARAIALQNDAHAAAEPQEQLAEQPAEGAPLAGPAVPRIVWLAAALTLAVWQAAAGRAGVGLLALAALLPIAFAPVRRRAQGGSLGWLVCGLAPALGTTGLAGAFPAIAGQARRWRMRAAYGAVGYWWLALAEPLLARNLWLGPRPGTPPRHAWEGSLQATAVHVIGPLLSAGVLLGALLWAVGALALPLLVRGRSAPLDILATTVWSALLASAAPILASGSSAHLVHASPRGAILGALLGGVLAIAARALRGPV